MITRAPGQGYWNFVVTVMVVVFIVYVTTNGDLPKWFALLTFKAAPPPQAGGGPPVDAGTPLGAAKAVTQNSILPFFSGIYNNNMNNFKAIGSFFGLGNFSGIAGP